MTSVEGWGLSFPDIYFTVEDCRGIQPGLAGEIYCVDAINIGRDP